MPYFGKYLLAQFGVVHEQVALHDLSHSRKGPDLKFVDLVPPVVHRPRVQDHDHLHHD